MTATSAKGGSINDGSGQVSLTLPKHRPDMTAIQRSESATCETSTSRSRDGGGCCCQEES